jgi:hypothetical protein
MARTHSPSLLGCNGSSEWQRQLKRGREVIFIGLAREASRYKRFPEKVVPPDEPMVSPCKASDHPVSLTEPNIAVELRNPDIAPTLYTDSSPDHPVLKISHSGRYCMI